MGEIYPDSKISSWWQVYEYVHMLIILMYPSTSFSVIFYNMKYKKDIIAMLKKERYNGRCKTPILWSDL